MQTVSLSGSRRENVGKKDSKALRYQGMVPCVIYGGEEQIHFALSAKLFNKILFTPNSYLLEIDIDGTIYNAVLKDVQYHPVSDVVLHADFLQIIEGAPVVIAVPVRIEGTSPGVIKGGKLRLRIRKLKIKALAEFLPDFITLDISKLDIGGSICVRDIERENLTFLDKPHEVVVSVKMARGAAAEDEDDDDDDEEGGEEAEGGSEE